LGAGCECRGASIGELSSDRLLLELDRHDDGEL
jgi:hypothetical protein